MSHIRRKAHLIIVLEKTISYLEYLGLAKWTQAIDCAKKSKKTFKMIYKNGPPRGETTTAQHTTHKIHHIENLAHTPSLHPTQHYNSNNVIM